MERTYTESELRQRIQDNVEQIIKDLLGPLRDDNIFKSHSFTLRGSMIPDGSVTISDLDLEPLRKIITESEGTILREFLDCLLVTMFEEDT